MGGDDTGVGVGATLSSPGSIFEGVLFVLLLDAVTEGGKVGESDESTGCDF